MKHMLIQLEACGLDTRVGNSGSQTGITGCELGSIMDCILQYSTCVCQTQVYTIVDLMSAFLLMKRC